MFHPVDDLLRKRCTDQYSNDNYYYILFEISCKNPIYHMIAVKMKQAFQIIDGSTDRIGSKEGKAEYKEKNGINSSEDRNPAGGRFV